MKRPQFSSIQAKVLFYSLLPFVLVIVIIVIVGIQVFERVPQRIARQRETELARVVAGQVERRMAAAASNLLSLGRILIDRQEDLRDEDFDLFDGGIALYDPKGGLLLSVPGAEGWDGLISWEFASIARERRPAYSDILRDPLKKQPAVVCAVPILTDQGEVKAIVAGVATLAASPLIEDIATFLEFARNRSGYAYLVDGRGKFIYHRDRKLLGTALAGTVPMMGATYGLSGATVIKDVSGERIIAGYAPLAGTRWALITRERWQVIVGPVRLYSLVLLAVLVVGGAASTMMVLFSVGRILKPIRDLTEGAARVAAGKFDHPIVALTGDEIEVLARRFNTMADSLKILYRSLEQKVESRTREVLQQQRQLAIMEERSRVARDLHDSVSQSLYSVTLFAEAARRHLAGAEARRAAQSLDQLIGASRQALKEMRLMVYELRSSELEQKGLIGALKHRLDTVEKRAGIEVEIDAPASMRLPKLLEQELYSLAQEALNNALKHAKAASLRLRVHSRGDTVTLEVQDDGVGFDPSVLQSSGGVGIRGMKERVEKLGGRLEFESAPSRGTLVSVQVKVEMENE
ncbi:MAG: HAMP domain-containing protein [Spirochaetaceae bacterium]|nr:MAG: HAMP domain-containing protein [Spirochaetaceae bacterium]